MDSIDDKIRLSNQRTNIMLNFKEEDRRLHHGNIDTYLQTVAISIHCSNGKTKLLGDLKWAYFLNILLFEELDLPTKCHYN